MSLPAAPALPVCDPVLYWRAGDERRAVLGLEWIDTKVVLRRVLAAYRARHLFDALVTAQLVS